MYSGLRFDKLSTVYSFIKGFFKWNWHWFNEAGCVVAEDAVTSIPAWPCWVGSCWGVSRLPTVASIPAMQTSPWRKRQFVFVLLWKYFWACEAPKSVLGFPWSPWTIVGVKTLCRAAWGVSPAFCVTPLMILTPFIGYAEWQCWIF